jgi:hypothetical protein
MTWTAMAALIVIGGTLSACSSKRPAVTPPSLTKGCGSPVPSTGNQVIPFASVSTSAGSLATVAVCVNGHGPYPFIVSTGTGTSVISPSLASTLGLTEGASSDVRGATCVTSAPTAPVQSLSMGGVALAPQSLVVATVPEYGPGPPADGMVGSDILMRFGAVRLDYRTKKMTLAGAEASPPSHNTVVLGQSSATAPHGLLPGAPAVDSPVDVLESPTNTLVSVAVVLSGTTEQFLVDTGAPTSSVTEAAASAVGLQAASGSGQESGVGCSTSSSTFSSGSWTIGTSPLPPEHLVAQSLAGPSNASFDGSLGADVLGSFHSVVLDYDGAHIWLGG